MSALKDRVVPKKLPLYLSEVRNEIEGSLRHHLRDARTNANEYFDEALQDALFPGGKRIRPLLTLIGAEMVGGSRTEVLSAAAAVEFIHNSSLIFDDLPCMDNASSRRGQLPLHERYGEGIAILVAVNLMNAAYGMILKSSRANSDRAVQAHSELVECIGPNGMLGGQSIDLLAAGKLGIEYRRRNGIETLRNRKTSSLIRLSLRVGAILVGARPRQLDAFSRFADLVGNAYQMVDDVQDRVEDSLRSRNPECDARFANAQADGSVKIVHRLIGEAKQIIESEFGVARPSMLLCEIADAIEQRIPAC